MRTVLMAVILSFYFCSPMAFAVDAAPNQTKPSDPGVVNDIINWVNSVDGWIQKHLW